MDIGRQRAFEHVGAAGGAFLVARAVLARLIGSAISLGQSRRARRRNHHELVAQKSQAVMSESLTRTGTRFEGARGQDVGTCGRTERTSH
jgi:hypothetical protein